MSDVHSFTSFVKHEAKFKDMNQKHIKTFQSRLLRTVCSAELNSLAVPPWRQCGTRGAEAHWVVSEVSLLSTWAGCDWKWQGDCCLPLLSQRLCVSEIACAGERGCFACSNVLTWVTPRPWGLIFQIFSWGYLDILQQKHILADLVRFLEHTL